MGRRARDFVGQDARQLPADGVRGRLGSGPGPVRAACAGHRRGAPAALSGNGHGKAGRSVGERADVARASPGRIAGVRARAGVDRLQRDACGVSARPVGPRAVPDADLRYPGCAGTGARRATPQLRHPEPTCQSGGTLSALVGRKA